MMNVQEASASRKAISEKDFIAWTMYAFLKHSPRDNYNGTVTVTIKLPSLGKSAVLDITYDEDSEGDYTIVCDPDYLDEAFEVVDGIYKAAREFQERAAREHANDNNRRKVRTGEGLAKFTSYIIGCKTSQKPFCLLERLIHSDPPLRRGGALGRAKPGSR